jgi:hypothetical protein
VAFLYYSTQSSIADRISKRYYKRYYVYCAADFYSHNPGSSSPAAVYRTFKEIADQGDRGHSKFEDHKLQLKSVAEMKFVNQEISAQEHHAILYEIANCETREFAPILYLILRSSVADRIRPVDTVKKPNADSIEYIIENMRDEEFERLPTQVKVGIALL